MNTGGDRRRVGPVLPELRPRWRSGGQRRFKMEKESFQSVQISSKADIAQFRNSVKHHVCVQMLQEGHHRSFSEIFSLLQAERAAAESGSAPRRHAPLEGQRDKLETMRHRLCRAEQAERTGAWLVACEQRLLLGQYFSSPEDLLLSLHFYRSCAEGEGGGSSRPATEARACMAELYLQQGELEEARQQAELCLRQADEEPTAQTLRLRARQTLWNIYSHMASTQLDTANYSEALELLHKGHSIATESEDRQMEGEAAYRLGLAYQRAGDHDRAKNFLDVSVQIYETLQDADGVSKAYKAVAKSLESTGNINLTIQCLEKLANISAMNGLQHNLVDAYLCLGNIYYTMGQYGRACEFFQQGYEAACHVGNVSLLQKAQVWVSCARARSLSRKYSADVESASPAALQRLLVWKETRGGEELGQLTDDSVTESGGK